jgi:hypothetical protein
LTWNNNGVAFLETAKLASARSDVMRPSVCAAALFGALSLFAMPGVAAPATGADLPLWIQAELDGSRCGVMRGRADPSNRLQSVQLADVRASIQRFADIRIAKREGWKPFGDDEPLMGMHLTAPQEVLDYVAGQPLDFSRPNVLMYTKMNGRMVLTGAAFIVRIAPGDPLPEGFSGYSDAWHVHNLVQAFNSVTETRPMLRGLGEWWFNETYTKKGDNRFRLAMLHTWVLEPNPDGEFADFNRALPYRELGLPESFHAGGSYSAARGLHLATPDGCGETNNPDFWFTDARGRQQRDIRKACDAAAKTVKAALARKPDAATLNRIAEEAWLGFEAVTNRVYTPEQLLRMDSIVEPGAVGHRL